MWRLLGKLTDQQKSLIEERLKYTDKELAKKGVRPGYRGAEHDVADDQTLGDQTHGGGGASGHYSSSGGGAPPPSGRPAPLHPPAGGLLPGSGAPSPVRRPSSPGGRRPGSGIGGGGGFGSGGGAGGVGGAATANGILGNVRGGGGGAAAAPSPAPSEQRPRGIPSFGDSASVRASLPLAPGAFNHHAAPAHHHAAHATAGGAGAMGSGVSPLPGLGHQPEPDMRRDFRKYIDTLAGGFQSWCSVEPPTPHGLLQGQWQADGWAAWWRPAPVGTSGALMWLP
jgi:hypothetical protein